MDAKQTREFIKQRQLERTMRFFQPEDHETFRAMVMKDRGLRYRLSMMAFAAQGHGIENGIEPPEPVEPPIRRA